MMVAVEIAIMECDIKSTLFQEQYIWYLRHEAPIMVQGHTTNTPKACQLPLI